MTQIDNKSASSQEILNSFQSLVKKQRALETQIETRQEEASRQEDDKVVARASTYSVEGIVKGLADLQLSFDNDLDSLADTLTHESEKLIELKRSINVANQQANYLQDVQIAAEALVILKQQQHEQKKVFEQTSSEQQNTFQTQKSETIEMWQTKDAEFEKNNADFEHNLAKTRREEEELFTYKTTRAIKIETDEFQQHKIDVEREVMAEQARLEKQWQARDAFLVENEESIIQMRDAVEVFPTKLDEARREAREAAIKKEKSNARVQLDIMRKEMENDIQVFDLTLQSLHEKINAQAEQIRELIGQLNAASTQTQSLAIKAIEGSKKHTA